jgi:uncharacterized membrane protein YedE/YeeE
MTFDWTHFTPWLSLAGGVLLGIAAAAFILVNGRILGISGIVGGLFAVVRGKAQPGDLGWRLAFLAGLLAAPLAAGALAAGGLWPQGVPAAPRIAAGSATIVAAGLLVGYGTRLGSGCTSGHGVCGLARLSPRALAATLLFMAAGFATVFVLRHLS